MSSSDEPDYWAQADYDTWLLEMAGDRSGIRIGSNNSDSELFIYQADY